MNAARRGEMFRRLAAARPAPRTELVHETPYELLVAVILSAQATDVGVNRATATLYPVARTPAAMVELGEEAVAGHVRRIGLWRNKAKNVVAMSRLLLERHGGEVPADRAALEALPGVGRKTAAVVMNVAFGMPLCAVDTHVFRVSNRTGLARGANPDAVEVALYRHVPRRYLLDAHHWLILHGRYVCTARAPRCPDCTIADLCDYREKTASPKASDPVPGETPG